ncbi:MAG: trypsin-like peptidase domain-containing protein, partial [Erysipelotrichaceae bacterium]|nr:trypsin-like peptidase domain-containing protein [Erysipelotrichaceae bacterium]
KVTTYDGRSYDAVLVGYDDSNDVAVLKIEAAGLKPVVLGSSESLHVGDEVIAIGNPLGELTFFLTKGSVSALNRAVTLSSNVTMSLIQTDAAINSGNSGGALFNMYGEVVGITNAKYSSSSMSSEASVDNIGFAIPMDSVKSVISSIMEKGYVSKPYIGVQVSDASDAALVYSVAENSPAAQAGLQANDIITALDGQPVSTYADLVKLLESETVGDTVDISILRDGEAMTFKITLQDASR